MATFIEAVTKYGPRLRRQPTIRLERLAARLADTTGLRPSETMMVLLELRAALLHYAQLGTSLELPGLGFFRPIVKADGRIRLLYQPDTSLLGQLDDLRTFRGEIENRENIGLTPAQYKALWDAEHPDNPLDLTFAERQSA